MRKEGFTLIELIIVIVIIGILAAIAVPKFAGLTKEAKISAVKGFTGSLRAATYIVHGKWLVLDNESIDNVTLEDGSVVKVCVSSTAGSGCVSGALYGYPLATSDGIVKAVNFDNKTFTVNTATTNTVYFFYKGFPSASDGCYVEYNYNTANEGPIITDNTTGCK